MANQLEKEKKMHFSSKVNSLYPSKRQDNAANYNFSMTRSERGGGVKSDHIGMHTKAELVRTRGGVLDIPRRKQLNLMSSSGNYCNTSEEKRLTKLLLNVNIHNTLGPVQVLMLPENTVEDLIKAAIDVYVKEKRRPLLTCTDSRCFQLHYSQFSLQSLKRDGKLINMGSRNFFLWMKPSSSNCAADGKSFWFGEVKGADELSAFPFTRFMDFLL